MASHSDTAWFGHEWLEQTIHFENPSSSWKIIQKLQEHESRFSKDEYVSSGLYSESCCIFACEETGSSNQAIMKVRMHVEDEPSFSQTNSQQPEKEIRGRTLQEIKALKTLTDAECSSTPKYITSKHENQNCHDYVPDGFLDYIVMARLEGITLSRDYLHDLRPDERQNICLAFKASYENCQKLGFINLDSNLTNLIWNKEKMKCYIVDWEAWTGRAYQWNDNEYYWWGLLSQSI